MKEFEFHKSEKGQGDEDWYYLLVDPVAPDLRVKHTWSHSVGTASFREGERIYSLSEFAQERPNQYRWMVRWMSNMLGKS